jgi:hypothetical protein
MVIHRDLLSMLRHSSVRRRAAATDDRGIGAAADSKLI